MNIVLANSAPWPDVHDDDVPLVEALEERGANVQTSIWDDPSVLWETFDICLIRSTWDCHLKPRQFLDWVTAVSKCSLLINCEALVRWNFHKSYLFKLHTLGVPIVPTVLMPRRRMGSVRRIVERRGWQQFIVKPAVSASSYRTQLFSVYREEAEDFAKIISADADVLVQAFVSDVLYGDGERSYCVINRQITHAVRRAPFNGAKVGQPQPVVPSRVGDLPLIERTLSALPTEPVYARVDIVELQPGLPAIAEVELIEPNLYLSKNPSAGVTFAESIIAAYQRDRSSARSSRCRS